MNDNLAEPSITISKMKFNNILPFIIALATIICGCQNEHYHHDTASGDYIIAEGGNMMWYNQPSASYYKGKYSRTYFSWCDTANRINIAYYDEEHKKFSPLTTIHKWGYADDHGQPIVHIKKYGPQKGTVHAFFALHNSKLLHTSSLSAENINKFDTTSVIDADDCGYPSIIENEQGQLALFYNRNVYDTENLWTRPLVFRTSDDNGETWSPATELINHGPGTWIYAVKPEYRNNQIHIAYSVKQSDGDSVQHVFYLHSNNWTKEWTHNNITASVTPIKVDTPIYHSPQNFETRVWDLALTNSHAPLVAFITYNHDSGTAYTKNVYANNELTVTTSKNAYYPSGVVFDEQNTNTVYCGKDYNNSIAIAEMVFDPQQNNYKLSRYISKDSTGKQVRPQIVNEYNGLKLLWIDVVHYEHFQQYRTNLKGYFKD